MATVRDTTSFDVRSSFLPLPVTARHFTPITFAGSLLCSFTLPIKGISEVAKDPSRYTFTFPYMSTIDAWVQGYSRDTVEHSFALNKVAPSATVIPFVSGGVMSDSGILCSKVADFVKAPFLPSNVLLFLLWCVFRASSACFMAASLSSGRRSYGCRADY